MSNLDLPEFVMKMIRNENKGEKIEREKEKKG